MQHATRNRLTIYHSKIWTSIVLK